MCPPPAMKYPRGFIKSGMNVRYRDRCYVVVYASTTDDLRIVPEYIAELNEDERKELWVKSNDPLLSVPFALWSNRARAAEYLEDRCLPGWKWLDGPNPRPRMKSGMSEPMLSTAIERVATGESQLIGILGPWEHHEHPYKEHSTFIRETLCSLYDTYRAVELHVSRHYSHKYGWKVDYQIGPIPHHVKKHSNDYGPSAPHERHTGEEVGDVGKQVCDKLLSKHWILR